VQGYNAQAVCTEDQIVIAAEVTSSSADFGQLEPMVDAAARELAAARVTDAPQVVLADAGYWHTRQIERLNARGLAVLVPPDAKKRKGERPGWHGGLYTLMRTLLATETGGQLYTRRNVMIEPVFGAAACGPAPARWLSSSPKQPSGRRRRVQRGRLADARTHAPQPRSRSAGHGSQPQCAAATPTSVPLSGLRARG
jgi:hypothetical protein